MLILVTFKFQRIGIWKWTHENSKYILFIFGGLILEHLIFFFITFCLLCSLAIPKYTIPSNLQEISNKTLYFIQRSMCSFYCFAATSTEILWTVQCNGWIHDSRDWSKQSEKQWFLSSKPLYFQSFKSVVYISLFLLYSTCDPFESYSYFTLYITLLSTGFYMVLIFILSFLTILFDCKYILSLSTYIFPSVALLFEDNSRDYLYTFSFIHDLPWMIS